MDEQKFWQAIKDAREGKPLDLSEPEFDLFSAIQTLGVEQAEQFSLQGKSDRGGENGIF